ncbi:hypothetical protein BO83DRAFT_404382 [Aspergillus eucalypticola CBS 122712]|uniref:Uncharacterized protein n=1 Tax=Aspergillus eucalypticola (strain CBS 122712 / IBT 29274) TaxID=1448314 RepID=A0A317UKK2_ASPEC|nr:uncharacterized protein BO83DRAFT_404382 [Aspergillus eucalypticola CBS 122712]PWY61668.1 hypothetical protein BO83DRAFT_404382 [Aspergillus eucalypticola CBS 122712]
MALPWTNYCSATGRPHPAHYQRCPTCQAVNPLPKQTTHVDLTASPEPQPVQSGLYIQTTSSSSIGPRTAVFGRENVRQNAFLRKKTSKDPASMKTIIHFYLYKVQEGKSEDDIPVITCTLLEQVQTYIDNYVLHNLDDFLRDELLSSMTGCTYVRSFDDQFRLSTGIVQKQPVFLSPTARGNVKVLDFLKKWFSYSHGSYQIYVIIQRRTVPSSTTDKAEETKVKEEKKIKREIIEKEESVVQEGSAVREDQDDLDALDAEIEALDASLKHQLSQSPSPPHHTRKRYVTGEDDKNRAAGYGPSGL